jgi:acetoin utilization deacetylase AcuC-like enzyme
MKLFYSDHFTLPLPEGHRFPMEKYARLRQRVAAAGWASQVELCAAEPASEVQLSLAHDLEYVRRVFNGELSEKEIRRMGFPWSPGLVERSRRSVGATLSACRSALEEGISANLAGGTHHAYPGHGEGYCVFNDVAVAARVMQAEGRARRVVILDCDVHQGNGTAAIFSGDSSVFTFSIHGEKNFPFHKEPSDLDIALPDGTGDEAYLEALEWGLEKSLSNAQANLAIYLAGADPFSGDRLGRMALSKPGLAERDRRVLERCLQAGLPVAVTMSGGYARNIEDIVDIHTTTLHIAMQTFISWGGTGA